MNAVFLRLLSSRATCHAGRAMASGIPGKPPPLPMSMTRSELACGLAECLRPMLIEFLLDLHREATDRAVVQIARQAPRFLAGPARDLVVLPIDVARVFGRDLYLLGDVGIGDRVSRTGQGHQCSVGDTRAPQQLQERRFALQR